MTKLDITLIGEIQEFKYKPRKSQAIQYTGKNGKAVVEFLEGHGFRARNGGSYVHVWSYLPHDDEANRHTIRKGDMVVTEENILEEETTILNVYPESIFRKIYSVNKNHELMGV